MAPFLRRMLPSLGLGLAAAAVAARPPEPPALDRFVKLGKIPDLRLASRPAVTEAEVKRIKDLIGALAALDKPDFGLSATMSGNAFSPVPGQQRVGALLLTSHGLQPSEALKALVAMGPKAMPFLLASLDDQTPTKLTINHEGGFGIMWHAGELPLNPVNPAEAAVYRGRAKLPSEEWAPIHSYTVKVGDACFVAIGQIVGRGYQAVRYQPTACIALNCPAHDARLCADVRAIWKSEDPWAKLFGSLLADYATEGVFNGHSLDGWSLGSDFQCGAALRLLYYFPQEASPLVADRLRKLDVGKDQAVDGYMRRCVANGVRAEGLIKAVAWSEDPAVRAALVALFKRAGDSDYVLAALPAVEDPNLIRRHLEPLVAVLPADEGGPYGAGYGLLLALGQRTPPTAKEMFERYLRTDSVQRCHTVCLVLRELKPAWGTGLLARLLADKRGCGGTYAVIPGQNEPRRPIRVCDEAAVTLSLCNPQFKFEQAGEHPDLDKQIAAIREALAR